MTVNGKRLGLSRRQFMQTSCGMAAAFVAMNEVYATNVFQVAAAEAHEPELMQVRAELGRAVHLRCPTSFVRDDFEHTDHKGLLPPDYEKSFAGVWEYAMPGILGRPPRNRRR
jgi:hypothetical protein